MSQQGEPVKAAESHVVRRRIGEALVHRYTIGGLLAAVGIASVWIARNYPFGSLRNMGPGFFPIAVGVLLIINAAVIAFLSDDSNPPEEKEQEGDEPVGAIEVFRILVSILGSFVVFTILVQPFGFVIAAIAMIVCSSLARRQFQIGETLLLAVGLTTLAALLFIGMLGLQLRMFPQ